MNWRGPWSGGHKGFERKDGRIVPDERELRKDKDNLLKWALVTLWGAAIAFLYYINNCQQQILQSQADIKASIAVLVERTTTLRSDIDGVKTNQAYLQTEIDNLRKN